VTEEQGIHKVGRGLPLYFWGEEKGFGVKC